MGILRKLQDKTGEVRAREKIRPLIESRMMRDILLEIGQRGSEGLDPQSVPMEQRTRAARLARECGLAGLRQSVVDEVRLNAAGITLICDGEETPFLFGDYNYEDIEDTDCLPAVAQYLVQHMRGYYNISCTFYAAAKPNGPRHRKADPRGLYPPPPRGHALRARPGAEAASVLTQVYKEESEGKAMLTIFNRKELTICQTQARCQAVCAKLDAAGIEYQARARDRSSPSPPGRRRPRAQRHPGAEHGLQLDIYHLRPRRRPRKSPHRPALTPVARAPAARRAPACTGKKHLTKQPEFAIIIGHIGSAPALPPIRSITQEVEEVALERA